MSDRRRVQRKHELHLTLTLAAAIIIIAGLYLLSTFAAWYVTIGVAVWIAVVGYTLATFTLAKQSDTMARECLEREARQERESRARTYGRSF